MLILKKLRFKGIGRFVEEQVIDFTILGKLAQLGGKNNNTKGSSGAGKSTVFMALDYLFGVSNKPSTILKSRLTDDGIFVEAEFDYNGVPLKITRGKKLAIDLDGVITTGNSAKTEEELDRIIGMPRELFRKMFHKRQKEGGFFLDMAPKDMNEFLMDASGNSQYRPKIELAELEIKKLEARKLTLATALSSAQSALKATQDAIAGLGEAPRRTMHQEVVLELKSKADASNTGLNLLTASAKLEEDNLRALRPSVTSPHFDRSKIEALEKEYKDAEKGIKTVQDAEEKRCRTAMVSLSQLKSKLIVLDLAVVQGEQATKKAVEISDQIKKIRQGKCYTCGHDWVDSQTEANLMKNIKSIRDQIEAGKVAAPQIPDVKKLIDEATEDSLLRPVDTGDLMLKLQMSGVQLVEERAKEKDFQWEETKKNKLLADEHAAKETALREKNRLVLDQARGQASIDNSAFQAALGELKAYEAARVRYETAQTTLKAQEASHVNNVIQLTESSVQVHNELEMAEELKRGLKSFLSCSFDEALETISENATTMIRSIPNMANATIQLEGMKETQDGKIKEEVNAIIHLDGDSNVPIKSLCGGERTATDLAIDLAVIDYVETKANKGISIFVLDEPFEGLDTVCIEMALEVLKNSNSNKTLVIVDHNPEVKAMVESKLTVIRDGATSRVIQAA